MRAVVAAKINGHDARFILDSGGFYSMMSSAAAAEFNLKLGAAAPGGVTVRMISGNVGVLGTVVKDFELEGLRIPNVEFLVGGPEMGADNIGLLGQNFLEKFDVEYDLARGMVRLFKVEGCENTVMAYWVRPGEAYSMIDIARTNPGEPHTIGTVSANGKQVRALFDTGAPHSMMDRRAARNAGVDLQAPGVTPGGEHRGVKTYMAPFKSFRVGDGEEIKNPRLKVVDMDLPNTEMLIGIDFFLSHRIFVANSQHKMYLTYNGGVRS
jgi:predicted aspartyl protease